MHECKKGIKIIILIISICFSFLFIILFSVLKDIPILSLLFKEYIDDGRSLFIPIIPNYNFFSFLPEITYLPNKISIYFTIGHLIDIIILINIIVYTEATVYHYLKRGLLDKKDAMFFNIVPSFFDSVSPNQSENNNNNTGKRFRDNLRSNFWNILYLKCQQYDNTHNIIISTYFFHKKLKERKKIDYLYLPKTYKSINDVIKSNIKCYFFSFSFSENNQKTEKSLFSLYNKKFIFNPNDFIKCEEKI